LADGNHYNPFFVVDIAAAVNQYLRWDASLPRVKPCFATKCSYTPAMLETFAALGMGFDVANLLEIKKIVSIGVENERMIFANTIKQVPDLIEARKIGVKKMTFDNKWELEKIAKHFPDAELVLRIKSYFVKGGSQINFSSKFGSLMQDNKELLELAKKLNLNIIGVSFHVGYKCTDPNLYA